MKELENSSIDIQNSDVALEQILDKAKPYLKLSLKKWLAEQSESKEKIDNAFKLSFDEFRKLKPEEQRSWRHRVLINNRDWLNNLIKTHNAEWLLILGGKIERTSATLDNFPSKNDVYQLAESKGFAPFIYVKNPLIEESVDLEGNTNWSNLAYNDFYPSISIFVGDKAADNEELIHPLNEIIADFDTGCPVIVIDQLELIKRDIAAGAEFEVSNIHLGMTYDFSLPQVKIGIKTLNNLYKSKTFRIRSVTNWKLSPFCIINSDRKGLVGRNLLIELELHVLLKGNEQVTQILQ